MPKPLFTDVHAHLQDKQFEGELDNIVFRAYQAGVYRIINSTSNLNEAEKVIKIAERHEGCFAMIGIHPEDDELYSSESLNIIEEYLKHPKVLGIGEIGLDYHYDGINRDRQIKVFQEQLNYAGENEIPVELHVRDAYADFFDVVSEVKMPRKKLLHCFSGSREIAKRALDMGFVFSIGGVLTFANAKKAVDVFSYIPLESMHLETDCPYLAPQGKRGQRNESSYVPMIAEFLAKLRNITIEQLSETLAKNAADFFGSKLK